MLNSLRVIELGAMVSAPYCTRLMADLGADVIKVEDPAGGDPSRRHGPFPHGVYDEELSGLYHYLNLNKRGVTLALADAGDREALLGLLDEADVLVENLEVGYLSSLGLGYKELHERNPHLIVTSISPFGQTGPYATFKGEDINVCAMGGISFSLGAADRPPLALPLAQASYQGALAGAAGTMAALMARRSIGHGQHVDVSCTEVFATLHQAGGVLTFLTQGLANFRDGHRRRDTYPSTILPCKDGYICLTGPDAGTWSRFLDMMGDPPWRHDPRFRRRREIAENHAEEVDALVIDLLRDITRDEFEQMCTDWKLPMAPVRLFHEVLADEHLAERELFAEIEIGDTTVKVPGRPYSISGAQLPRFRRAPMLGEHNNELLSRFDSEVRS